MKKFFTLIALISIGSVGFSQIPTTMDYEVTVKNSVGELMTNHAVGIQVTVIQGSQDGTILLQEAHFVTTDANGKVTLSIGDGTNLSGAFELIDWADAEIFIKTERDLNGGTAYTLVEVGQMQF